MDNANFEAQVNEAGSLDALLAVLVVTDTSEQSQHDGQLWTKLPTYGGEEPRSTHGVWSWDETRLLVTDYAGLRIVRRDEWRVSA